MEVLTSETNSGSLRWEVRQGLSENVEYTKFIAVTKSKLGDSLTISKTVKNDVVTYILNSGIASIVYFNLRNLEKAIWKQHPKVTLVKIHVKTQAELERDKLLREKEKKKKQELLYKQKLEKKKKQELLYKQKLERKKQRKEERQRLQKEKEAIRVEEKEKKDLLRKECEAKEKAELEKLPQIGIRDFVVRRNVFKCMHSSHKLENIVATINIIDNQNEEKLIRVNAGYCTNCKLFFIMESTYNNLKSKGIPICRISDEKTYLKNYSVNGMVLAQESILMQYGYNVNQLEGLSSSRRQKILAVLIDKRILGKSEIISYLDFFISQRQTQSKYQIAISKWEADREFVENYRIGEYHQYGVNAIYRR